MNEKVYEAGGKVFEVLVKFALDKSHQDSLWGEKLAGVHVVSDFVIGTSTNPSSVILVTHSTSESGTNMKFWRNIEELFEIKTLYPKCVVTSVIPYGNWKPALLDIMKSSFDASLVLSDLPYGGKLEACLAILTPKVIKKSLAESYEIFIEEIARDSNLKALVKRFASDFSSVILGATPTLALNPLWEMERTRVANLAAEKGAQKKFRNTYVKALLVRLLFLSESERVEFFQFTASDESISPALGGRLVDIGLATPTTIKARPIVSDQYLEAIRQIGAAPLSKAVNTVEAKYAEQLAGYLDLVRDTEDFQHYMFEVLKALREVSQQEQENFLFEAVRGAETVSKRNNRLYWLILLCKHFDSRFSFDVLSREAGLVRGSGLQRFANIDRYLLGHAEVSDKVLQKVIRAIVDRIKNRADAAQIKVITESAIESTYATLIKHRTINPLHELVLERFIKQGYNVIDRSPTFKSCLSSFSMTAGNAGDPSFSSVISKGGKKYICHIISAYASTHKHKEYPGKLRVARYNFTDKFVKQTSDDAILILDGTWGKMFGNDEDVIAAFKDSGWSVIRHVDELFSQ